MSPQEKEIYFNVAISTSLVLFGFDGDKLRILLKKHDKDPYRGAMLLPSQYVKYDEATDKVAKDLLLRHTKEINIYIEQLKAFSKVFRNPLGRVVNISYYGTVKLDGKLVKYSENRGEVWLEYSQIPDLAFDHNDIIDYAKERLKRRVKRRPIGFYLLPEYFTISQLQKLYENALNREMDKRNFRKKIFNSQLIIETDLTDNSSSKKFARLYKFDEEKYEKLSLKGYDFLF